MVRDMFRLAVIAVLAELDREGDPETPLTAPRKSAPSRSRRTKVRNWRSESDENWLFVEDPE